MSGKLPPNTQLELARIPCVALFAVSILAAQLNCKSVRPTNGGEGRGASPLFQREGMGAAGFYGRPIPGKPPCRRL